MFNTMKALGTNVLTISFLVDLTLGRKNGWKLIFVSDVLTILDNIRLGLYDRTILYS